MNKELKKIFGIAKKPECRIVGLMSGTSLDGLDIVLCNVSKKSIIQEHFKTVVFPTEIHTLLHKNRSKEYVSLKEISYLNTVMAIFMADEILSFLVEKGIDRNTIDLISSHGQTIYHAPNAFPKNTFQIVDGDHLAQKTGIVTISDFRQKHISAGGEGAPLAIYLDEFLFTHEHKIRVTLNLGGIANLSIIPATLGNQKPLSTDVGPANTLINDAMRIYYNQEFDQDGSVAAKGQIHQELLNKLLLDPFFQTNFPKTTGQELFNMRWVEDVIERYSFDITPQNLVTTLTELTKKSIHKALQGLLGDVRYDLIVSGGGCKNITLMNGLKEALPNAQFLPISNFGTTSEAKEAVLMAFLAFNLLHKEPIMLGNESIHLGKICLPN